MGRRPLLLAVGAAIAFALLSGAERAGRLLAPAAIPGVAAVARTLDGVVREVTAYNVGVAEQTDDDPCISASGVNVCALVARGMKVCAANFVPIGTILDIEEYGQYVVVDRLSRRYPQRVDIAMRADEVAQAVEFGLRRCVVRVRR